MGAKATRYLRYPQTGGALMNKAMRFLVAVLLLPFYAALLLLLLFYELFRRLIE